jgi:hypothetical protein
VYSCEFQLDTKYYTAVVEFVVIVKETEQRDVLSKLNIGPFVDAFVFVFRPQNVTPVSNFCCLRKESDILFSLIQ